MNYFKRFDSPITELPPNMRDRSHFTFEPTADGAWALTVHRKGEPPSTNVFPSKAAANRARLKLDGFLGFVRGV